jgi:hypothetical protein
MALLPKFITWAGAQNYSVGPDAGFPVETAPGFVAFTPGLALPAQGLNYVLGSLAREAALIPSAALNNWTPVVNASVAVTATVLERVCWDDANQLWWATGSTPNHISISPDDGQSWLQLANLTTQPKAIAPMPPGTPFGVSAPGTGVENIVFITLDGTVTNTGTHLGVVNATGATVFGLDAGPILVGLIYDATTGNTKAYTTVDGTTIVDVSAALPVGWKTAGLQPSMTFFSSCDGPAGERLVVWGNTVAGVNQSMMMRVSWNGAAVVFTAITIIAVPLNTGRITAVAYNATLGLWGVWVDDGTNGILYTSADLVTWTAKDAFTGLVQALVTVGSYWVLAAITGNIGGSPYYRAYGSLDGLNFWGLGTSFNSGFLSTPTFLAAGDGGVAMWSNSRIQMTRRIG